MAGPFPGMDPFLEDPVLWPGTHQGLITGIRNALNRVLPAGFVADMGERIYVVRPDRSIFPDVAVFEQHNISEKPSTRAHTGLAVADPRVIVEASPIEAREVYVEIVAVGAESHVVTVIEVLSHANKERNSEGRDLYLRKQKELLQSDVNMVEIDLLRWGEHTVAAPKAGFLPGRGWAYLVCVHRAGNRGRFETWPRTLRERLPRFWVPLEGETPDVAIDLQEVFDRNYDDAAYVRRIDYRGDPVVRPETDDAAWARELLVAAGAKS